MIKINVIAERNSLFDKIECVAHELEIELEEDGIGIQVNVAGEGIHLLKKDDKWKISIGKETYFLRAMGLLIEAMRYGEEVEIKEQVSYDSLGLMIDCSRNAVPHFEAYKKLMNHIALMGYTTAQLYMEDVYEVEGYPYFGYMRGRYSSEELKRMVQYADKLGIKLIPAIQTLAHFGQALKWESFKDIVDVGDILLIDSEKTYELIDAMFKTLASSFTSREVNIGMDEAHMVGLGKYLQEHGYQDRLTIMLRHFNRVIEIAKQYGFRTMMWSDMFFRLTSGGKYDPHCTISKEIAKTIPKDVSLIYWDYYSEEKAIYDGMFEKHHEMSENIIFAGGAWKWMGFQPNNLFSEKIAHLAHASCTENGIKKVLLTAWGDNGGESSLFSILPTLQMWAELCYRQDASHKHLTRRLKTCADANYKDFMTLDLPMLTPGNVTPGKCSVNPPKYILYQDILCGLFDKHIKKEFYEAHFKKCVQTYEAILQKPSKWDYLFNTQKVLCELLQTKCHIGLDIRNAYKKGDKEALRCLATNTLPLLIDEVDIFIETYQKQWLKENKIFGLDIFDIRIGGLRQRMLSAKRRLLAYCEGDINQIEELEEELLYFDGKNHEEKDLDISVPFWHSMQSASNIASV